MPDIRLRELIQGRGLRPTVGLAVDSSFLATINNLKASPTGLIPFDPLADTFNLGPVLTYWPIPQSLVCKRHIYIFVGTDKIYLYEMTKPAGTWVLDHIDMIDMSLGSAVPTLLMQGDLFHIADRGDVIVFTNGLDTIYRTYTGVYKVSQHQYRATRPHIDVKTISAFKELIVAGGITTYGTWKNYITALMSRYPNAYSIYAAWLNYADIFTSESVFWAGPPASIMELLAPYDYDGTNLVANPGFTAETEYVVNPHFTLGSPLLHLVTGWLPSPMVTTWIWDDVTEITHVSGNTTEAVGSLSPALPIGNYVLELDYSLSTWTSSLIRVSQSDPLIHSHIEGGKLVDGVFYAPVFVAYDDFIVVCINPASPFTAAIDRLSIKAINSWLLGIGWTREPDQQVTGGKVLVWDTAYSIPTTQTMSTLVEGKLYRVMYEISGGPFYLSLGGTKSLERNPGGWIDPGTGLRYAAESLEYTTYIDFLTAGSSTTLGLYGNGEGSLRRIFIEEADKCKFLDSVRSGASGWLHIVGAGEVLNLKPLGDNLVAYCTKGVWILRRVMDPMLSLAERQIYGVGIASRDAVAGSDNVHFFLDATGNLCVIKNSYFASQIEVTVLGYQRLFSSYISGKKPVLGYDEALEELRIGNSAGVGYIFNKSGLTSNGQGGQQIYYLDGARISVGRAAVEGALYTTFTIVTDPISAGTSAIKNFNLIEIIGVGVSACSVTCSYRHTITGAMTNETHSFEEDGSCHLDISGTQVSFSITGTIATNGTISDVHIRFRVKESL